MAQVVLQSPKGSALRAFSKLQLLARLLWVKLGGGFCPIVFFFVGKNVGVSVTGYCHGGEEDG